MSLNIQKRVFSREEVDTLLDQAESFNKGPKFSSDSRIAIQGLDLGYGKMADTVRAALLSGVELPDIRKEIPVEFCDIEEHPKFISVFKRNIRSLSSYASKLDYITNHPYLHKMTAFAKTAFLVGLMALTVFSYLYIPGRVIPIAGAVFYTYWSSRFMRNPLLQSPVPRTLTAVFGGGIFYPIAVFGGGIFYPIKGAFIEKSVCQGGMQKKAKAVQEELTDRKQEAQAFIQSTEFQDLRTALEKKIEKIEKTLQRGTLETCETEEKVSDAIGEGSAELLGLLYERICWSPSNAAIDKQRCQTALKEWEAIQAASQAGGVYGPDLQMV